MTLIIAEANHDDGFFVADTLLTVVPSKFNSGPFNGKYHALKVHILTEKLCIALAGNYELGLNIINQVDNHIGGNIIDESIFESIYSLYRRTCIDQDLGLNDCDFLVMLIMPNNSILKKISGNGVEKFIKTYIGSTSAYKKLQSLRISYNYPSHQSVQQTDGTFISTPFFPAELEKNFIEISEAMNIIPPEKKAATVGILGNCMTRVRVNRFGCFEYMQQAQRGMTYEEGEIGFSLLSSAAPKFGFGIFYQAGFGYCWIVGDKEYCRRIDAITIHDFIQIAFQKYQLNLVGATW